MKRQQRIVVAIPWHYGCTRQILKGIADYAERADWDIRLGVPTPDFIRQMLRWRPDGFIIDPDLMEYIPAVALVKGPKVIVPDIWNAPNCPGVSMDNEAIGRMAAEYFHARGFNTFAYCGHQRTWSGQRYVGYQNYLSEYQIRSECIDADAVVSEEIDPVFLRWLRDIPKPMAVLAGNDYYGHRLALFCHYAGIRVPEQVAIVGVDNDDVFAAVSRPTLSSVDIPWGRMGTAAAEMLEGMIGGAAAPLQPLLLPPTGIVTRQSSDFFAITDPDVKLALQFIAGNAVRKIDVDDVVNATTVSRRALERKFQEFLKRSPLDIIRKTRLLQACRLLVHSDHSISQVAQRSGFGSTAKLYLSFQAEFSMGPLTYRQAYRALPEKNQAEDAGD